MKNENVKMTLKEVLEEVYKFNPQNEVQRELYAMVRRIKILAERKKEE